MSSKSFFLSRKTADGFTQAGTHLIIIDDLSCGSTTAQKSNPAIINYYRHFLIKGNDDRWFSHISFVTLNWNIIVILS